MAQRHVKAHIHREKGNTRSVEEQVTIAHAMWDHNLTPGNDGIKRNEVEEQLDLDLDYSPRTSLQHLVEAGIVAEFQRPGPNTYVIADWKEDGIVNGEVEDAAEEGIVALLDHIEDNDPVEGDDTPAVADGGVGVVRQVVSEAFDYEPQKVEEHLTTGDPVDKLNDAVEAIQEHEEISTRDDYGEILFLRPANRYRLSGQAVELYNQEDDHGQ